MRRFADFMMPVQKNDVDWDSHSDGVNRFAWRDPQARAFGKAIAAEQTSAPLTAFSRDCDLTAHNAPAR